MADQEAGIDLGIDGLGPAEHIGRGGFADVYRAEQLSLRRTVAVKVLRAQASDDDAEAKFERECHAIGAVSDHPHIVGVHEGGFTRNGRAYLVMEYLPGGSLLDRLSERGPMDVPDIVDTTVKIARALSVAHRAGVLHRDVKPANIMISAYGEPALGDFGIARIEGGHQTATGLVTASFAHAAPEVLEGMSPSASADVYSLGSTLFELMTGKAPYYSPTDESIWPLMKRILSEPMPTPESVGMSPQLGEVFVRSTARNPSDRYADADDLADALEALVTEPLALARYPLLNDPNSQGERGTDPTVAVPGPGTPGPIPAPRGPDGPLPATKPDLMSLQHANTSAMPEPSTGRFSDRFGPGGQPVVGGPPRTATPSGSGGRAIAFIVIAAVLGAVIGGAALWLSRSDDGGVETGTSAVTATLAAAAEGPLQAGESYEIALGSVPAGAQLQLFVDGEPMGAAAETLPPYLPSVGRHSVAVEILTDEGSEVTTPIELYATGGPPTEGYTANLGLLPVEGQDAWATTLEAYDVLAADGHDTLAVVETDQMENLRPGFWAIYTPGFGEDADAAEAYCEDFDLETPDRCHASYFRPQS